MISIFDLEKLRGLLKDFYEISHIRITVFDENLIELVSYPEKVAAYCVQLPFCPQLARIFKKSNQFLVFSMNVSLLITQPAEIEGK